MIINQKSRKMSNYSLSLFPPTSALESEAVLRVLVTAHRYLEMLTTGGFLEKHRLGRENYYINLALVSLLFDLNE